MAGIHVTYQPVVLEANQSPGLARAEGLPGELTTCWALKNLFQKLENISDYFLRRQTY